MTSREHFSLRALYLYAICLITLLTTLFSAASLVRNTVGIVYPDPNTSYWGGCSGDMSEAECAKTEARAEDDARRAADSQRRWAVLEVVGNATLAALAAPAYLYHWRRIQRDRTEAQPDHTDAQ